MTNLLFSDSNLKQKQTYLVENIKICQKQHASGYSKAPRGFNSHKEWIILKRKKCLQALHVGQELLVCLLTHLSYNADSQSAHIWKTVRTGWQTSHPQRIKQTNSYRQEHPPQKSDRTKSVVMANFFQPASWFTARPHAGWENELDMLAMK